MSDLYLRRANVIVSKSGSTLGESIDGLRLAFNITKTSKNTSNKSLITIYNLGPETAGKFQAEEATIVLNAGYGEPQDAEQIFVGNIEKAILNKTGVDRVLQIEALDAGKTFSESFIEKSYAKGTPVSVVFKDVASSFEGLSNVASTFIQSAEQFASGFTASGPSKDVLQELAGTLGIDWTVQDNEFMVVDKDQGVSLEAAILVSFESGLLDAPKKTQNGIEFRTLLNPKLRPLRACVIETEEVSGTFRIDLVQHQGDTDVGQWTSRVEAVQI